MSYIKCTAGLFRTLNKTNRTWRYAYVKISAFIAAAIGIVITIGGTVHATTPSGHLQLTVEGAVPDDPSTGSYDAGTFNILDQTAISHDFIIRNTSESPITIENIKRSCGCTSVVVTDKSPMTVPITIVPGQTLTVTVQIDVSQLLPGPVDKDVWLYAAGQVDPLASFAIRGELAPAATLSPSVFDFGQVRAGQPKPVTAVVTIDSRLNDQALPLHLISSNPNIEIIPDASNGADDPTPPVKTGSGFIRSAYTVRVRPEAYIGPLDGSISLVPGLGTDRAGNVGKDLIRLTRALAGVMSPITGAITGTLSASPSSISFGSIPIGKRATLAATVSGLKTADIQSCSVQTNSTRVSATLTPNADGGVRLTVTVNAVAPSGLLREEVYVRTPTDQRLGLRISALISE